MRAVFIALALFSGLGGVAAQERPTGFPSRPVRIVYGAPPGGDGGVRHAVIADVEEARPGAGGTDFGGNFHQLRALVKTGDVNHG